MIWVDSTPGAQPAGKLLQTLDLDGQRFELFRADAMNAEFRDGVGWTLLTFRAEQRRTRGTIDLHALLSHLVSVGLASADEYVASVELGNEILGGAGVTWIEEFGLDLRC